MVYRVDAIVIGAGVVGLACARRMVSAGLETIVLESDRVIGQGISSRNSEVIHAGLYYRPGSLKARLCRLGRDLLYRYCEDRSIPHKRVGKLVVAATKEQLPGLEIIANTARINGCDDLQILSQSDVLAREPALRCVAALNSPSTGIIDTHALMTSFVGDIESRGGAVALASPVSAGGVTDTGIELQLADVEQSVISAKYVINSAGLEAPAVAASILGFPEAQVPARCYAKGSYFSLSGRSPFNRLIYPVPERGGLGVHLTLDLVGQARFGPDVEWIDSPEYSVNPAKAEQFLAAIRTYWPGCELNRLNPGYAGVRPKLGTREQFADDFVIQCQQTHGVSGLINLFGIESPGLTASMAIADEVASRLNIN